MSKRCSQELFLDIRLHLQDLLISVTISMLLPLVLASVHGEKISSPPYTPASRVRHHTPTVPIFGAAWVRVRLRLPTSTTTSTTTTITTPTATAAATTTTGTTVLGCSVYRRSNTKQEDVWPVGGAILLRGCCCETETLSVPPLSAAGSGRGSRLQQTGDAT